MPPGGTGRECGLEDGQRGEADRREGSSQTRRTTAAGHQMVALMAPNHVESARLVEPLGRCRESRVMVSCLLAVCDHDAGAPTGGSPTCGKRDRFDVDPAAREEPRDGRVRVPHLARAELVAAPDGRRHLWHELEQATRTLAIGAQTARALDRLCEVRDASVAPAAYLVAEEAEASGRASRDRALGDDSPLQALAPRRRLLDHEPSLGRVHLQRRMEEVA